MIEPTDEQIGRMVDAFWAAHDAPEGSSEDGVMAVLAVAARDRCMERRGHVYHPLARKWPAGRGGSHPHYCVSCSDGEAAGPGCGNCRSTGMDQTPSARAVRAPGREGRRLTRPMSPPR